MRASQRDDCKSQRIGNRATRKTRPVRQDTGAEIGVIENRVELSG
jgi:hypothetical protein